MTLPYSSVLVTGAAGCIGAQVVANLIQEGITPIVFDLSEDRRRLNLVINKKDADDIKWVVGDITEKGILEDVISDNTVSAIIHLAALQVPFCNENPLLGAQVNVIGQINVFEAALRHNINGLAYASSIAALPPENEKWPATLYGTFKMADEAIANIYWNTKSQPSIGIRPHTVYGPGRDQGVTAAPTKAMLAAAAGKRFCIPFSGPVMLQHTTEVANAFIAAALTKKKGAYVADLAVSNTSIEEVLEIIRQIIPSAELSSTGEPLPFVSGLNDKYLRSLIGDFPRLGLSNGVKKTIDSFKSLLDENLVSADDAYIDPLGKSYYNLYDS